MPIKQTAGYGTPQVGWGAPCEARFALSQALATAAHRFTEILARRWGRRLVLGERSASGNPVVVTPGAIPSRAETPHSLYSCVSCEPQFER